MSSRSRRDSPEQVAADAEAGHMLATDADRAREARDWRRTAAGGPPAVVARDNTPERWQHRIILGPTLARAVARAAHNDELTPSAWIRELVIATIAERTGEPADTYRENLTVTRKHRAKALNP